MRRMVRFRFTIASPTSTLAGRVSASCPPQLQAVMAREAKFVVCDQSIYDWFRRWCIGWAWERLNTQLRERLQARFGWDLGTRTLAPGSWAPSERRRPASAGSKGATRGGQEGKWPQEAHALVDDTEGLCSPASNVARERHHLRSRWVDQQSRVAKEFAREET